MFATSGSWSYKTCKFCYVSGQFNQQFLCLNVAFMSQKIKLSLKKQINLLWGIVTQAGFRQDMAKLGKINFGSTKVH